MAKLTESTSKPKQRSRHRILEAALVAFETVGYQAATIDDIAEAAGLSRRTVYHHFKTKSDILRAASIEQASLFLQQMKAAVPPGEDFPGFYIDCLCYVIEQAPDSRFFMLQASAGLALDSALVYFTDPQLYDDWLQFFEPAFNTAQAQQNLNPDIKLVPLLNWFGRIATSYFQFRSEADTPEAIRTYLLTFVEPALRANTLAPPNASV